ncbi:uncharacterized protein LOC123870207 [Maniola jurtina]|uniref:uncharacterized protein LOC123870207 n=1 Tax=Maniola jurtina TaxID=191418 RepID=UPI001E68D295|nr:uncharacterized protein LOC123870207 [Maniola jurtina]
MCGLTRAAPALLLHVNLLLMLYAGALLAAAARLQWDPSLYVAARELFPRESRALRAALPALAAALLLLAHAALAATRCRRAPRRVLLILMSAS